MLDGQTRFQYKVGVDGELRGTRERGVECGHVAIDRVRQRLLPIETPGQGIPGGVDIRQRPAACRCKRATEIGLDASQAMLKCNSGQWVLGKMLKPCRTFICFHATQLDSVRAPTRSPTRLQHSAIDTPFPQALSGSQACTPRTDHDHLARTGTHGCLGGTQPIIPRTMSHCRSAGITSFSSDDQAPMQHLAQGASMQRRSARQQGTVGTEAERVATPVGDMPRGWSVHAFLR